MLATDILQLIADFNSNLAIHLKLGYDYVPQDGTSPSLAFTSLSEAYRSLETVTSAEGFYEWVDRLSTSMKQNAIEDEQFRWTVCELSNVPPITHLWAKGFALKLATSRQ
jgi:hypothetical protein